MTDTNFFFFFPMASSASSSSSDSSSSALPTSAIPNVFNFLMIKLDRTDYPLLNAQILPLLCSMNLVSFVDGTNMCPSAFLKDMAGNLTIPVNLAFEVRMQQDAMVISWINSSVHLTVLTTLIGKTSSRSVGLSSTSVMLRRPLVVFCNSGVNL